MFLLFTPTYALAQSFEDWQPGVFPLDQNFVLEDEQIIDNAQVDNFPLNLEEDIVPVRQVDIFPLETIPEIPVPQPPPPPAGEPVVVPQQPVIPLSVTNNNTNNNTNDNTNINNNTNNINMSQAQNQSQTSVSSANASTGRQVVSVVAPVQQIPVQQVPVQVVRTVQQVPVVQTVTAVPTKTPVVAQQELPRTGLPMALWTLSALAPFGLKLRSFGRPDKGEGNIGRYVWQEREFLASTPLT